MDEREGVAGERERVPVRVQEKREAAVLGGDVLDVVSVREDLEDAVPVMEVVDPILACKERVDDGEEQLGGVECGIGLACPNSEGPSPVQITCAQ